jgi:hypothetical protein
MRGQRQRGLSKKEIHRYMRQSQARVKSGSQLVGFLLAVAAAAFVLNVGWLAKLGGLGAALFTVTSLVEYLNVRKLRRLDALPGE